MKKLLALTLAVLMCCACVGAFAETYEMKFATSSTQMGIKKECIDLFLDYIEEKSEGQIVISRYIDGELCQNAEDMLAMLTTGAIEGCFEGDMSLSWVAPEWISYTSVPFAFKDRNHMIAFFMSDVGKEINERLIAEHGFRFLDSNVAARGGRMLTGNKAITSPADMQGVKFRVPNVIGTVASWEAMGAKVIGVPWSELFTSLQNGLVDAQENPYAELESGGFYQVQKYIMETAHQFGPQFMFISEAFYQSLTPELQQVMQDANKAAFDLMNAGVEEDDARIRQKILDNGNIIVPREEIDIDAFKKIVEEQVLPQFEGEWAEGGWEYIQSLAE